MGKPALLGSDYDILLGESAFVGVSIGRGCVTVSSKFVIDLLPPALTNDGRRMTARWQNSDGRSPSRTRG